MLRVLCSESELGERGETLAVGDLVRRPARRVVHAEYGTALDAVEWRFDRSADEHGTDAATISGRVEAISAVYVELTRMGECEWVPGRGTAHLEPLRTTADTRMPDEDVVRTRFPAPVARTEDGDERLSGWVVVLADAHVATAPGARQSM